MGRSEKPDQFGELLLSEAAIEAIEKLDKHERIEAIRAVAAVFERAQTGAGHTTSSGRDGVDLSGWNTMPFGYEGKRRFIYRAVPNPESPEAPPSVEVLYVGKKSDDSLYKRAGRIAETFGAEDAMGIWDALDLLDTAAHDAGLPDWDRIPEPMQGWERDQMVADGVLTEDEASVMSSLEAWNAKGEKDARAAGMSDDDTPLAQVAVASSGAIPAGMTAKGLLESRLAGRCGKPMPRARAQCARPQGHTGACRRF